MSNNTKEIEKPIKDKSSGFWGFRFIHRLTRIGSNISEHSTVKEILTKRATNLLRAVSKIIEHTIVTLAALGSMKIVHLALDSWLGKDFAFFDYSYLKVKYFIDAADIAILIRLILALVLDVWKISKKS